MNKNYFVSGLITLILITAAAAGAQDSSSTLGTVLDRINFDLGFGAYYMSASCDHISSNKVKLPDYLVGKSDSGYATDNPEYHGASYFELQTVTELSRDLTLYASLMAEHRGYSYGVYDSRRMDVYPIFNLKYRSYPDSNSLLPLATGVNIGNFQAYRRFEGLQIYNMDYQGALLFVQYKKLRLSHLHIADLLVGLRLNIGDYLDYMISLEGWNIFKGYSMDMRLGLIEYAGSQTDDDIDAVNFSIGLYKDENFRAYGELGYRLIEGGFDYRLKYAALLGIKYNFQNGRLHLETRTEYRYYGGMYNYRFKGSGEPYRDFYRYSNDVYYEKQIYPISYLNRPFSQWAVFTEYHKRYVDAVTFFATTRFYVARKHYLYAELDFNGIKAEDEEFFLYPFFKVGYGFEPAKGIFALMGITNKIMNLDKHYPTYYYLQKPMVIFEIRRDVNWPVI